MKKEGEDEGKGGGKKKEKWKKRREKEDIHILVCKNTKAAGDLQKKNH